DYWIVFDAALNRPRFAAAVYKVGIFQFTVHAQVGRNEISIAPHQCIAAVIDPGKGRMLEHELVAQVRAGVIPGELHLIIAPTIGERKSDAKVVGVDVAFLRQILTDNRAPFDIELPTLRTEICRVAVADQAGATADRTVELRVDTGAADQFAADARLSRP